MPFRRLPGATCGAAIALVAILALARVAAAGDHYSPGGWSTLHQGPGNRKLVPSAPLAGRYRTWSALAGASVLTAPTLSPDGRTLYVTTGQAAGHANLHAFDLDGKLLWRSEPWQDAEHGVDPCAILSSPIVDREGGVYVGDCNQLFAYRPGGELAWVVPLPPAQEGDWRPSETLPINAFTTAVFTGSGHVLGVTNFGDVVVVERATGKRLNRPLRLPGRVPPPAALALPEAAFGHGMIAPELREWTWQLLLGGRMRSANTPAVETASGRVFVAATSTSEGKGALYGLDLAERDGAVEVSIAFATEMGPGSGSSPALSPEGDLVYVSDERGLLSAIDARTGAIRWEVPTRAAAAAAAVAGNGDVIALQAEGPALVAVTREGKVRWQSDLSELARAALPEGFLLGEPVAMGNGNPTVVAGEILVPVVYGYVTHLGRRIPWPVRSAVVAVDGATGKGVRDVVELLDDSTGITAVLPDGTILNSLGSGTTSAVSPLAGVARWLLPGDLAPLLPLGGLQVSRPEPAR